MRVLFLFMDGIGLGRNDPNTNPFARAKMPVLQDLLGGYRMVERVAPYHNIRGLIAFNRCLPGHKRRSTIGYGPGSPRHREECSRGNWLPFWTLA